VAAPGTVSVVVVDDFGGRGGGAGFGCGDDGGDGDELLMMMVPMVIMVDLADVVGEAARAMMGAASLAARKLKQRFNVLIIGVECFQSVQIRIANSTLNG